MILYITNIFLACMNSLKSRKTAVLAVFFKVDIFHLCSIKLECKLFCYLACISAKRISAKSLRKILQHNLLSTCSSSYCKLSLYFCVFFSPPSQPFGVNQLTFAHRSRALKCLLYFADTNTVETLFKKPIEKVK